MNCNAENNDAYDDRLNESQRLIANTLEGMIVVDAGPGTGKTFTVVSRCINILSRKDADWKDLIMLTFTKNAASEMRERVQSELADRFVKGRIGEEEYRRISGLAKKMTIGTFDSFCLSVVKQSPYSVSRFFNIEEGLTRSAGITENESFNRRYFKRFLDRFLLERGAEYGDMAAMASDMADDLYSLINRLMSRGILPRKTKEGRAYWFGGDDGRELTGNLKELRTLMDSFKGFSKEEAEKFVGIPSAQCYDLTSSTPVPKMLDDAAYDDRSGLLAFLHELYYEYIRRCIADDHLTFGLVACFAFVILYTEPGTRERVSTKYLIVDEFQDTNSNQLMISLMILKEPNLCVVGDWKQGIYGFRFVSIENITEFDSRVRELRRFLNDDTVRIEFHIPDTQTLSLTENYRSSQLVIDKAYESLLLPGTQKEQLDTEVLKKKITLIKSTRGDLDEHTAFECVKCEDSDDEVEEVLRRIDRYRLSGKYHIVEKESKTIRDPRYGDIAVLCRKTGTCRKIYEACLEKGIPAFLQGDVDIMNTREGRLLLAWLRYISNDKDPWGLTAILADMNVPCHQLDWMRAYDREAGSDHVPPEIKEFRKHLRSKRRRITELISDVYSWYGLDNNITQAITTVLSSTHRSSLITISDVIRSIESDMDSQARYDVDGLPDSNAVIIQTLHKSKGLEYPIVIIPGIDSNSFPSNKDSDKFKFSELMGVRCTKEVISFNGEKKVADSWKTAAVRKSIKTDYSEERRLLFVGISRAKQYVTMIAGKPSQFFTGFAGDNPPLSGTKSVEKRDAADTALISKPVIEKFDVRRKNLAVHDLMRFDMRGKSPDGDSDEICKLGMQYGTAVHKLAELLARGIEVPEKRFAEYPQLTMAKSIINGLRDAGAELWAERECSLPLNNMNATVRGVIDLMAVFPDRVEIHDWKTDADPSYKGEYELQLSVYAHILAHFYPDRKVVCCIDWLTQEDAFRFEPLPLENIEARAREALTVNKL